MLRIPRKVVQNDGNRISPSTTRTEIFAECSMNSCRTKCLENVLEIRIRWVARQRKENAARWKPCRLTVVVHVVVRRARVPPREQIAQTHQENGQQHVQTQLLRETSHYRFGRGNASTAIVRLWHARSEHRRRRRRRRHFSVREERSTSAHRNALWNSTGSDRTNVRAK